MRKLVLSGFLASEEIYINQLEALLLVSKGWGWGVTGQGSGTSRQGLSWGLAPRALEGAERRRRCPGVQHRLPLLAAGARLWEHS